MDILAVILISFFSALALVVILILLVSHLNKKQPEEQVKKVKPPIDRAKIAGEQAEEEVYQILSNRKEEDERLIRNFRFYDVNRICHEIDCLYFSYSGIFVIEVKGWSGRIVKKENGEWLRFNRRGESKLRDSPIIQNKRHINGLIYLLRRNSVRVIPEYFHSLIAFTKADISLIEDSNVIKSDEIMSYFSDQMDVEDFQYVRDVYEFVKAYQASHPISEEEMVKSNKEIYARMNRNKRAYK